MTTIQQYLSKVRTATANAIVVALLVGGFLLTLVGIVLALAVEARTGLVLLVVAIAMIAVSRTIELLQAIENDLNTIKKRVQSGVLGLLP